MEVLVLYILWVGALALVGCVIAYLVGIRE